MKELKQLLKKMTQRELADKLGITQPTISIWLKNERLPKNWSIVLRLMIKKSF